MRVYPFLLGILVAVLFQIDLIAQQNDNEYHHSKIEFEGLKKTKVSFLNGILARGASDNLALSSLDQDLQILRNLPSIADATYTADTIAGKVHHTVHITERTTTLPIVNFGGIRGNIWFSLGASENNFRGVGNTALAFYQNNNGRHSGKIFFKKPRISNSDWGYSFLLNKWSSSEPIFFSEGTEQYLYDNNGIGGTLIRNFGLNSSLEVGGTLFRESYDRDPSQELQFSSGPESINLNKFLTKLEYKGGRLDYDFFYLTGLESIITFQNVYTFSDNIVFNSLMYQGRLFTRPRKKLNLAFRVRAAISTNDDTPFAPFVADSHVNIRGIGNRIDRGTAQVILNAEARYTAYHKKFWSIQAVAFSDSGTWRNPGGQLVDFFDSNQFRQFIGLGIRINYLKIFGATLRVDYGVDIYNKEQRGFVIGLGQYY